MTGALATVRIWSDMVKLSHSVFALPFALAAAFLAAREMEGPGRPYWGQLGLVIICMVAGRSVAMTFNRIVDTEIDARNPRTAGRPLPSGRLSRVAAYSMLIVSAVTFGVGCLGFHLFYDNTWPVMLSGPVLIYLCGYSFTKRFTRWSHFYLGSAVALSPLAAWIAIDPLSVGWDAVLLVAAVTCWIGGFDILYACQDVDIDRREGLFSLPAKLGPARALWIARGAHVAVVVCLLALGAHARLGLLYVAGVAIVAALLFLENSLVTAQNLSKAGLAFSINGFVGVVFGAATILDVLIHS